MNWHDELRRQQKDVRVSPFTYQTLITNQFEAYAISFNILTN
jgi:hypothetical protein